MQIYSRNSTDNVKYRLSQPQPTVEETAFRSSAIPSHNDNSVYVVVGDTFEDIVFDDAKDVFINLGSPMCSHCRHLAPTWEKLGDRYKEMKDKIIV